jgi:hypothetical protein
MGQEETHALQQISDDPDQLNSWFGSRHLH